MKINDRRSRNDLVREAVVGCYHAQKREVISKTRRCKSETYKRLQV